jgi:Transcription factor Tfb4
MSAALSAALCMLARAGAAAAPGKPRLLVLAGCRDTPGQYIACMNAIFSAQRLGVLVDGVSLAADASSFVEQARARTARPAQQLLQPEVLVAWRGRQIEGLQACWRVCSMNYWQTEQ